MLRGTERGSCHPSPPHPPPAPPQQADLGSFWCSSFRFGPGIGRSIEEEKNHPPTLLPTPSPGASLHRSVPLDPCLPQHDSFVVPASLRSRGEGFLTVDGEGQHRYSRYGRAHSPPQQQQSTHVGASSDRDHPDGRRAVMGAGGGGVGFGGRGRGQGQQGSVVGGGGGGGGGWEVIGSGFGSSPFPAVDSFLRSACCCCCVCFFHPNVSQL